MYGFECLNLENYFNHKLIIDKEKIDHKGGLKNMGIWGDHCGDFLNPSSLPPSLELFEFEGVPFLFPDKSIEKYDNICCENQLIQLKERVYTSIYYLGCCESERFREKVKLLYVNGHSQFSDVFFYQWGVDGTQWRYDITDKNCKIAIIDKHPILYKYVYFYCSHINYLKYDLKEIELPDNPNVHILSITLKYENRVI